MYLLATKNDVSRCKFFKRSDLVERGDGKKNIGIRKGKATLSVPQNNSHLST